MSSNTRSIPRRRSMTDAFFFTRNSPMADIATDDLRRTHEEMREYSSRRDNFANSLPKLSERDLTSLGESDSACPICLTAFLAVLSEEETAIAMESIAHAIEELGVTRLVETCGHVFCRKDIREWIHQGNTTCPTCRTSFIEGPSESLGFRLPDDTSLTSVSDLSLRFFSGLAYIADGRVPRPFETVDLQNPLQPNAPSEGQTSDRMDHEEREVYSAMYS